MLSDQARSDAKLILLIDEKWTSRQAMCRIDVIGDPEDVLLMSRGLDQHTAERLCAVSGICYCWNLAKKYFTKWLPLSKKSYPNAKEKRCW